MATGFEIEDQLMQDFQSGPFAGFPQQPKDNRFTTEPQQEQQEQPQFDPIQFLSQKDPVPVDDERFEGMRNNWWKQFANRYHDRQFTDIDDYMSFVTNLKDDSGAPLGDDRIANYIRQQALENIPPEIGNQYHAKIEEQRMEQQFQKQLKRELKANEMAKQYGLSWSEKKGFMPLNKDLAFENKLKRNKMIADELGSLRASREKLEDAITKSESDAPGELTKTADTTFLERRRDNLDAQIARMEDEWWGAAEETMMEDNRNSPPQQGGEQEALEFQSFEEAEAANLPIGTQITIFDPNTQKMRPAIVE